MTIPPNTYATVISGKTMRGQSGLVYLYDADNALYWLNFAGKKYAFTKSQLKFDSNELPF